MSFDAQDGKNRNKRSEICEGFIYFIIKNFFTRVFYSYLFIAVNTRCAWFKDYKEPWATTCELSVTLDAA